MLSTIANWASRGDNLHTLTIRSQTNAPRQDLISRVKPIPDDIARLLDANANRLAEGLRTMEDWWRFGGHRGDLAKQLKLLRHELDERLRQLGRLSWTCHRNIDTDPGTQVSTPNELSRDSIADVVNAAAERCKQALRTIEEFTKTIDPKFSSQMESVRYRLYTLTADSTQTLMRSDRRRHLEDSNLYALIDLDEKNVSLDDRVEALAQAGVDLIQLRDKTASDRQLISAADRLRPKCQESNVLLILNDRVDLAFAADVDGVHVGQDELPVEIARRIQKPERLLGLSTHTIGEVRASLDQAVDLIGCGPTFPGHTKSFDEYAGLDFLVQAHQTLMDAEASLPAFAIGGITCDNIDKVLETGVSRVAVTAAVDGQSAEAIERKAKQLKQRLGD
ncbi:MAG: thiamine phosphate synthase [Planctomycetota bacterium]